MGIIANAVTIMVGGLLGSLLKSKVCFKNTGVFGICVLLISTVGIVENIFSVSDKGLKSDSVLIVVFSLLIGCIIGDKLRIEDRLSNLTKSDSINVNAFIDSTLFFGIGGLQICGPIVMALQNDSSQLYLKSVIDFPFALMFGAIYGRAVVLSAFPVAAVQMLIAALAYLAGPFISDSMVSQLCTIGYIILFFSGFNLICEPKNKIKNVNMIPSVLIIIMLDIILSLWR